MCKPLQAILPWFGKIAHFDVDFTVFGVVRVSAGFLAPQCFPNIPPIETYTKETKVGKLWQSFLQNQGTTAATSSDLWSFLPKTVQYRNDREKQVSAHRRGAGAKIAFLNDYARDLAVCLIVPGKLLVPQISIVRFVGLLFSWRCSAIF